MFMLEMFGKVGDFDINRDGKVIFDEIFFGQVMLYMGYIDINFDNVIDEQELSDFLCMFNNGCGFVSSEINRMDDGD